MNAPGVTVPLSTSRSVSGMTRLAWLAAPLALLLIVASGCGSSSDSDSSEQVAQDHARIAAELRAEHRRALERQLKEERAMQKQGERALQEAPSTPSQGSSAADTAAGPLPASAAASFEQLANSISGEVGLAIAPLDGGPVQTFGSLQSGHAWSTIKVPILVTLMRERGSLGSAEESSATSAIEASDNSAAAALFQQIESSHGGLTGASNAVSETLAAAGDLETAVATAPPPAGAVSTYGQTVWSLSGAATFFRALVNQCLLDATGSEYVLGLMENVISEQRWGLGESGFDPSISVAMKGGWGPESGTGGYLVRQGGVLREGSAGVAVAMMAKDSSGTYEAGAADLTVVATWLREELSGLGGSSAAC